MSTENKYVVKNVLRPPNEGLVKSYAEGIFNDLLQNAEVKLCLTLKLCKEFPSYTKKLSNKMKARTACRLAAGKKHCTRDS